jgi:hypothetical protein
MKLNTLLPASTGFLLGLLFNREDGGNFFLKRRAVRELRTVAIQ